MVVKKSEQINSGKYTVTEIRKSGALFGYNSDIVKGAFFNYEDDKEFSEKEAENIIKSYANKKIK